MDDVVDLEWAEAPWWLDAVSGDEVAEVLEEFSAVGEHGPMMSPYLPPVEAVAMQEHLHQAAQVPSPGPTTPLAPKLPTCSACVRTPASSPGTDRSPAGMARELGTDAEFQWMVYHPVTGYLLDYTTDRYRLPAALNRFCALRDRHCRFPGSTRPAHRCDPDGTLHWTTPLGRHYTTHPWDYRPDSER